MHDPDFFSTFTEKNMKNSHFFLIVILAIILISCAGEHPKKFTLQNTDIYELDTSKTVIKWDRFVDNKLINKKVKLFGSYVDVKMENVTFNTSGNTPVIGGDMQYVNDEFSSGKFQMDFSVCRFYSEEEESFFTVKNYPPSTLLFKKMVADTINKGKYNIEASLTLRDSTKDISIPAETIKDSLKNLRVTGTYIMQTLDWQIRENPDRNNIRKDEITFNFDLFYQLKKSETDTIYEVTKK